MDEILFSNDGTSTNIGDQLVPDLASSMTDMLAPFIWLSVALTLVLIALYVSSMLRKRKVENAILDIQKTIHEINERDKARLAPSPQPQKLPEKETIIAHVDVPREDT